ncbi:hypothetical protein [Candidatus Methylomirabilis sp.]|uniref:hypothetical protein n=1 Tax=Candidatus Methylomirabilis sp. TaxID=2032687 RepID=UPI002A6093D9|nr:hypothetical protein [Candidatus Methylomirabilis sp.]
MKTALVYLLPLAEKSPEQLACARAAGPGEAGHPNYELHFSRQLVHGKLPLAGQDRFDIFMA